MLNGVLSFDRHNEFFLLRYSDEGEHAEQLKVNSHVLKRFGFMMRSRVIFNIKTIITYKKLS